jgi:hypothetical protein
MNVIVTVFFKWPGNQAAHTYTNFICISFLYTGSTLEAVCALYNGECGRLALGISEQLQISKKV